MTSVIGLLLALFFIVMIAAAVFGRVRIFWICAIVTGILFYSWLLTLLASLT